MARRGEGHGLALLKDPDVRRWHANVKRGSVATADVNLRSLSRFLRIVEETPASIVKMSARRRDDLVAEFVERQLTEGKAGSYVVRYVKVLQSWLDWNGQRLSRRLRVPGAEDRPRLRNAHIPSQEELSRVFQVADARSRTAISLVAFAGLRPEVLGDFLGEDGLRIADLADAHIEDGLLVIDQMPLRIVVAGKLNKTTRPYFTFLGPEGCAALQAYLRERVERGETLTRDSPLITPRKVEKPFMRTINIGDLIRKPMRLAGLKEPPYMWRSYFASRAMLAEGKGLTRDYRQFMMGHKGDIEHVYALHKKLPPDTIEAMRKGYEAALDYLETAPTRQGPDPTMKLVSVLLQASGIAEQELATMDLAGMSDEDLVELLRRGAGNGTPPAAPRQRIIDLQELSSSLAEGWLFKAPLPDGRVIVEFAPR